MVVWRYEDDDAQRDTGEGVCHGALEWCYAAFVDACKRGEVVQPFGDAGELGAHLADGTACLGGFQGDEFMEVGAEEGRGFGQDGESVAGVFLRPGS